MAILVDFQNVIMTSVHAAAKSFGNELDEGMLRHFFLNQILHYKNRFGKEYGEIILCCDHRHQWRRKVYPYYKAQRAEGRAESPLDWKMIFEAIANIRQEMNDFMPYKVVHVDEAEGDDCIAVLVKYFQENEVKQVGLEEVSQPIMIISADGDFSQLQVYKNVKQWSPLTKLMIIDNDPVNNRYDKIIRGDRGDGVPGIFSADDVFVTGTRQTAATKKRVEPVMEALQNNEPIPEEHARNFDRNKKMIDLVDYHIPESVESSILECYNEAYVPPRSEILKYFMEKRLRNLAPEISQF